MKADKENASKKGWAYDKQRLFDGIEQRKTSGDYSRRGNMRLFNRNVS